MQYVVIRLLLTCLAWVGVSATDPATARDGPRVHAGVRSPEGGHRNVYILSFGLFGEQRVFEREARGAAGILAATLGGRGHTIVRFNTRSGGGATPRALFGAMRAAVRGMKSDRGVLVLVLTSTIALTDWLWWPGAAKRFSRPSYSATCSTPAERDIAW